MLKIRVSVPATIVAILSLVLIGCSSGHSRRDMVKAYDDGCKAMKDFDYVQAVSLFDKARVLAEDFGDVKYIGDANKQLGEIYLGAFSPDISISYFDKAFESFLQIEDTLSAFDALYHKGLALYQGGDIEGSRAVLEDVDSRWHPEGSTASDLKCALALAYLRLSPPLATKAADLFDDARNYREINDIEYSSAYACALMLTGQKEESESRFESLRKMGASEFEPYLFWKARAAEAAGDYSEAYRLLKASDEKGQSYKEYSKYVTEAHTRFLTAEAELAKERATNGRLIATILIISLLALIIGLVYALHIRKKKHDDEKNRLNLILATVQDKEKSISRKYFETVGGIMEEYIWGQKRGDSKERVVSYLDSFAADVSGGIKRKESFESVVDRHFDGIVSDFRNDFPNLREDNYRLLCYSVAGFDSTTIALIMDASLEAVYMRRSRLRKTIAASDCTRKETYLKLLDTESITSRAEA